MMYLACTTTGLYPFHLVAEHQRAEEGHSDSDKEVILVGAA
jgi:hypothetical protein